METYLFFRLEHAGPQFYIRGLSSDEAKRLATRLASLVDCGCCTVAFRAIHANDKESAQWAEKWDYKEPAS